MRIWRGCPRWLSIAFSSSAAEKTAGSRGGESVGVFNPPMLERRRRASYVEKGTMSSRTGDAAPAKVARVKRVSGFREKRRRHD